MLTTAQVFAQQKLLSETDRHYAIAFKALGDVSRFRMFRLLIDRPEISVSTLAEILRSSVPLTSQHIKVLTHARLVAKRRDGKNILVSLDRRFPLVVALEHAVSVKLSAKHFLPPM